MEKFMTNVAAKPSEAIADSLVKGDYNRMRLAPQFQDPLYPHLADVRMFLDAYVQEPFDVLLDYGCGGSPYRPLFQAKKYLRADYVDCGNLDCLIADDGKVSLADQSCDCVLSTQVLEHVAAPQTYLSEAFRVLRPGGKLILTTHGIWEEHGCPYDFRRWTADGLSLEAELAGFKVSRVAKLTTGPRAALFLFSNVAGQVHDSKLTLFGIAMRLLRRSKFGHPGKWHQWMDQTYSGNRVVTGAEPGHEIYIALGIEAVKPKAI
jgi:SAM-dependent methyltransferase